MQKKLRANLMLLVAALIWGSTFVAQTTASDTVEPFTFLFSRSFIGFLFLIPVIAVFNYQNNKRLTIGEQKLTLKPSRLTIVAGVLCGVALTIASYCQQKGITLMTDNASGKAGFITALYIVFTPIFGIILKRRIPKIIAVCVPIATLGFYLLCIKSDFSIELGDLLTLVSAFFFTFHIFILFSSQTSTNFKILKITVDKNIFTISFSRRILKIPSCFHENLFIFLKKVLHYL